MEEVTDNVVSVLSYEISVVKNLFLNLYKFLTNISDFMEIFVEKTVYYPSTVQEEFGVYFIHVGAEIIWKMVKLMLYRCCPTKQVL